MSSSFVAQLDTSVSQHYLLLAAGTGLIATVIPSFFVNAGMGRIGAASTAMISNVSPLLTIYFAVLILGEDFTLADAHRNGTGRRRRGLSHLARSSPQGGTRRRALAHVVGQHFLALGHEGLKRSSMPWSRAGAS